MFWSILPSLQDEHFPLVFGSVSSLLTTLSVWLSVGRSVQKKISEFLNVQILGKCRLLLLLLKNPSPPLSPLQLIIQGQMS